MSVPIELLSDRVLVKRDAAAEKIGLLWIPPEYQKKPTTGVVVAMGPGLRKKNGGYFPMPDVKLGTKVAFRDGYDVKIGDDDYVIMRQEDVAGEVES